MRIGHKFAVLALIAGSAVLLSGSASAQVNGFGDRSFGGATIHGNPPSVTSFGFGGHPGFHGVPPSVTSLNFGNAPVRGPRFGFRREPFGRRRHRDEFVAPFFGGGYYLPYYLDDYGYGDPGYYALDPGTDDSMEENHRGGPTIFDRRGPGEWMGPPPEDYRSELNPSQRQPAEPVAEQPSTVLVFKDGHQVEIKNYAIVGGTLYDLSEGRTRKVELAELNLPATVKQNDDRGVSFQLPAGTKLN